ncbi:hypothetical protein ABH935_009250 [Catenulispora sp. GAS73]|uniref:hypothetical protein n=1 Tax=Catenulispora sp. GAS73 TaxID=3156269 RepID=UPI0035114D0A
MTTVEGMVYGYGSSGGNGNGNGTSDYPAYQPAPTAVPTKPQPVNYPEEGGSHDPNPYATQTDATTQFGWGGGRQPVSVDIHKLGDYAIDMKNIADFERDHAQMQLLMDSTAKSWTGGPLLPEGSWALDQFQHNAEEFVQYLQNLYNAVYNIAFAAKSVADCYNGTDGWSAADVNAVDYAFGDNVPRPAGWYAGDDKTWLQAQAENKQATQGAMPPVWKTHHQTQSGNTTITFNDDGQGHTQTITVTTNPDGGSTMVIVDDVNGKKTTTTTTSQVRIVGNTQTTVDRQDGRIIGSTTVVTSDEQAPGGDGMLHVVTTTKLDDTGAVEHRTVVTTYTGPEGPSTTTAEYDAKGNLLSEVTTGTPTASAPAGSDSTINDADKQIDQTNSWLVNMPVNNYYGVE